MAGLLPFQHVWIPLHPPVFQFGFLLHTFILACVSALWMLHDTTASHSRVLISLFCHYLQTPRLPAPWKKRLSCVSTIVPPNTGVIKLMIVVNELFLWKNCKKWVLAKALFKSSDNFNWTTYNNTANLFDNLALTNQTHFTCSLLFCPPHCVPSFSMVVSQASTPLSLSCPWKQGESFIICWINGWLICSWAKEEDIKPFQLLSVASDNRALGNEQNTSWGCWMKHMEFSSN